MGKIADIRAALATAIGAIDGLSARPYAKDIADVPVAMVGGPEIEYDKTFGRGTDDYRFPIMVFASRNSDEGSQTRIDSYIDPYGGTSIKAAIESDSTLGGVVDDLQVVSAERPEPYEINGITYLGTVLMVHVMASGKA